MKILIVGEGGREHALAWKAAQSAGVDRVYVAPGNAGTAKEPNMENVMVSAESIKELIAFAKNKSIDLTLVGPENPLVAGIVDDFTAAGLQCFGPSARAA
ncbi:MAG TPA: phosphoribosylamine--glycine ligase N-terminal domain-containing protein, partial [Gammaproteobacteria bacterium]|nr:phosphoribosylamine--glycine ligase N-terminal domain-containing protein [Gammaproteobacteria bacterium]